MELTQTIWYLKKHTQTMGPTSLPEMDRLTFSRTGINFWCDFDIFQTKNILHRNYSPDQLLLCMWNIVIGEVLAGQKRIHGAK